VTAVTGLVVAYGRSSSASGNIPHSTPTTAASPSVSSHGGQPIVTVPRDQAQSLRLTTGEVRLGTWPKRLRLTGRLELNESQRAYVTSPAEGVVREVRVELGELVSAGQVVAYLHSREVGEAKLRLVQDRLSLESARKHHVWQETICRNTAALLESLQQGAAMRSIDQAYRERPMGSYREQLLSAAVRRQRAAADHERLRTLGQNGIVPEKEVFRVQAEYEAAEAAYRAIVEQISFDAQQQVRLAQQRLQEAESAVAVSRSQLLILGYPAQEIDALDPIAEGERVAYYPVRAPLAGTVLAKPAVLSRHVDAQTVLLEIADLSSLWLRADVFEKDLAMVQGLEGQPLAFRTASYPDQQFTARMFTSGNAVDDDTRAARLLAVAENGQQRLKPGMFVEIELDAGQDTDVVLVPPAAVQRHERSTFVFVQRSPSEYERRDIQIGRTTADAVEVTAGLQAREAVLVAGGFALKSQLLSDLMVTE
jgi:cobalt-zinc-cadmium efflux system membrane fusion protein